MDWCSVYTCMQACSMCLPCVCRWSKHLAALALVYLVIVHGAKTVVRNREW